jgi:hypothetical protein
VKCNTELHVAGFAVEGKAVRIVFSGFLRCSVLAAASFEQPYSLLLVASSFKLAEHALALGKPLFKVLFCHRNTGL